MSAGQVCSRTVITAAPDESARVGAQRMSVHGVGTLVIVKSAGSTKPMGIVTDRDIVVRCVAGGLDSESTPLSTIMTEPVRVIDENVSLEDAIQRMADASARRLVVTGDGDRIVGILSLDDLLNVMAERLSPLHRLFEHQGPHIAV